MGRKKNNCFSKTFANLSLFSDDPDLLRDTPLTEKNSLRADLSFDSHKFLGMLRKYKQNICITISKSTSQTPAKTTQ